MFAAGGGMSLSVEKESGMRRERKEEVGVQPHTKKLTARSNRECARTIDNKQQPRPGDVRA